MADDQRLYLARVDVQEADIVDDRGGVAEVEQDRALLLCALRFEEKRKAPFVVEDIASVRAAPRAWALMNHAIHRAAAQELVVLLVDQHADRELVDRRTLVGRRGRYLHAGEAAGGRGPGESCRRFQEVATSQIVHVNFLGFERSGARRPTRY